MAKPIRGVIGCGGVPVGQQKAPAEWNKANKIVSAPKREATKQRLQRKYPGLGVNRGGTGPA